MNTEKIRNELVADGKRNMARDDSLPVVMKGSAAWNAWRHWRKEQGLPVAFMESRDSWTVPTEFPPAAAATRSTASKRQPGLAID